MHPKCKKRSITQPHPLLLGSLCTTEHSPQGHQASLLSWRMKKQGALRTTHVVAIMQKLEPHSQSSWTMAADMAKEA